jgi:hypothetical protein
MTEQAETNLVVAPESQRRYLMNNGNGPCRQLTDQAETSLVVAPEASGRNITKDSQPDPIRWILW